MKNFSFLLALALLGAGCSRVEAPSASPIPTPAPAETSVSSPMPAPGFTDVQEMMVQNALTMEEVAKHAGRESCYTVVRGDVYDLTEWISKHPGGAAAVLKICGKDGTEIFGAQHGGREKQEAELAKYKIGPLVKMQA